MSDPVVDPSDLEVYMGMAAGTINEARAEMLLADAQALCQTEVSPLPAGADAVVRRMAASAYTNPTGARVTAIGTARAEYGSASAATQLGVVMTAADRRDLRRLAGSGGAFSVDLTPSDVGANLPFWDAQFFPVITQ